MVKFYPKRTNKTASFESLNSNRLPVKSLVVTYILLPLREMACSTYNYLHLSHKIPSLFISKPSHAFPITFTTPFSSPSHTSTKFNKLVKFSTHSVSVSAANTYTFTWDDVVRISQPDSVPHDSSDLSGFFQKVKICNRGSVIFFCLCILTSVLVIFKLNVWLLRYSNQRKE